MEAWIETSFEAAHSLDIPIDGRSRLHGHSWRVRVTVSGEADRAGGTVLRFRTGEMLKAIVDAILEPLDHNLLNDVEDLITPSNENLARWIGERAQISVVGLASVEVWRETCGFGARWRPAQRLFGGNS